MNRIVEMIRDVVVVDERPCVFISGGLDSTVVLHHVMERAEEEVFTYSARFGMKGDECVDARRVSEFYGTVHAEVEVRNFIESIPRMLSGFDRPRYNVWPCYLAGKARLDERKTVYLGEGADEHFGGYHNRNYLEGWATHIDFIKPTHLQVGKMFDLEIRMPFDDIDWKETLEFFEPPNKRRLREAYVGLIPDFVIEKKKTPPAFSNYWKLWEKEIQPYFPYFKPKSVEDVREVLRFLATEAWLKANTVKGLRYNVEGDSYGSIHGRSDFESGGGCPKKAD